MYNLTNLTAANGLSEIMVEVNYLSGGILGISTLVVTWLLITGWMIKTDKDARVSIATSSAVVTIIAVLMSLGNLIPWNYVIWPAILMFLAVMMYKIGD